MANPRVDIHGNPIITEEGVTGSIGAHKDSGKFGYYRVASNNYITTGPVWAEEKSRREEKGDEILRKYGFFQQGPRSNTADRYRKILENGGVREFCLEQILELGWHRKPPKGIKFPQLEGLSPIDHKCKYCGKVVLGCKVVRGEDGSVELEEDELNRRRHEAIAHKEISNQEQLGRTLATALAQLPGGGSGSAGDSSQALALFAKLVTDMQERQATQDKLMADLMARVTGVTSGDLPAVESVPPTMARKKGKGKTK